MWQLFSRLTEKRARCAPAGRHFAGRGLWLCCADDGSAKWRLCLNLRGDHRDMDIGKYPDMNLKDARKMARQWRGLVRSGLDPRVEQEKFRNAAARNLDQFYC